MPREMNHEESECFESMFNMRSNTELNSEGGLGRNMLNKQDDESSDITLEITINVQRNAAEYKKLGLPGKIKYLYEVFRNFCKEYGSKNCHHVIEYCQDGEPHLHGYASVVLPDKVMAVGGIEQVLRMYARSLFLHLPRVMFKQFGTAQIDTRLKRYKTAGLCINMKSVLEQGWTEYMNKTQ